MKKTSEMNFQGWPLDFESILLLQGTVVLFHFGKYGSDKEMGIGYTWYRITK